MIKRFIPDTLSSYRITDQVVKDKSVKNIKITPDKKSQIYFKVAFDIESKYVLL